jgi:hypothetical protein
MKVPYQMVAATDLCRREAHMTLALQTGYPRLKQVPIDERASLTVACYGPSLEQTYQSMQRPILSMSGATRWLADRGIIPDYHLDMDPREHKVAFIDPPVPGVHYLMATVCHPTTWPKLAGQQVTLWHTYSAQHTYDWVNSMDHGELVIHGGSTIGLTALHVGGVLGYRHFEVHGMDGSFADDARSRRHAGTHPGTKQQDGITWDAGGKRYQTSRIMANAVTETLHAVANFPIFCVFHGEGLTQALLRERDLPTACCVDETEKAARLRTSCAHILDPIKPAEADPPSAVFWDALCAETTPEVLAEMERIRVLTEPRRAQAKYNTGTVTLEQMAQLRTLCLRQQPKRIVEVGTFIGNSTLALQASKRLYTCDRDNDCFPPTDGVKTYPYTTSTAMLGQLVREGVKADLFFYDGRIQLEADLPLIKQLSHADTMHVVDDYAVNQKGIVNLRLLATLAKPDDPWCLIEPDHRLAEKSTLAALVPRRLFRAVAA